ncbi:hypothetical protein ACU8KI_16775 [Rhizobium leguminosarum]
MSHKLKPAATKADIDIRRGIASIALPTATSVKTQRHCIEAFPSIAQGVPMRPVSSMIGHVVKANRTDAPPVLDRAALMAMILEEYDRLNRNRRRSPRVSKDVAVNGSLKAIKAWKRMSPAEIWDFRASAHIGRILQTSK